MSTETKTSSEPMARSDWASAIDELAERLSLEKACASYREERWDGAPSGRPTLQLEDISGIPFIVDIVGVEEYQHRARVRAGDGDLFAAVTAPSPGYEQYCQRTLDLGAPQLINADPALGRSAVARACQSGAAFEVIAARAKEAGGLLVHPYMAIADVWNLAAELGAAAGVPISVIGPPPPVTWIANDKALFGEVVSRVLGPEWLVETHLSRDPAEMASLMLDMASRHEVVGIKRTRCASAMGNAVFPASQLRVGGAGEAERDVREFLYRTEWPGDEDVLMVAWEETDLSPSTQLWIPPLGAGAPRLDGVYEQILEGSEKVFLGSRPSTLGEAIDGALGRSAISVAEGLQRLGYVGRCSFDHLVVGDPDHDPRLLFIECNGRWGGTSTPMSLVDRLIPGPRPPYRAQDVVHEELVGKSIDDILDAVGDRAFNADTGEGRFIFYNVGPLAEYGKLDVISLGASQEEAEAGLLQELPALLGL